MNWLEILLFIVFVVISVISKIARTKGDNPARPPVPQPGRERVANPRRLPPQPPVRPEAGRPEDGHREAVGPHRADDRDPLEMEIEQFLRQSHGRAGKVESPPEWSPAPPIMAEREEPIRRLSAAPQSVKIEQKANFESVADHVDRHIQSAPITEQSRGLGKDVAGADESMEDHLRAVFDHDVGSLDQNGIFSEIDEGTDAAIWESSASKRQKRSADAGDRTRHLIEMLSHPDSMQQAMILSEVLRRPDFD